MRGVAFTCPRCGATSHHPVDREEGYCASCRDWTGLHRTYYQQMKDLGGMHLEKAARLLVAAEGDGRDAETYARHLLKLRKAARQ